MHTHEPGWCGVASVRPTIPHSFFCDSHTHQTKTHAQVALAVFPVTFLFLTSFAGFTVPLQDLPAGWLWASYVRKR